MSERLFYNGEPTTEEEALEEFQRARTGYVDGGVPFETDDVESVVRFDYDNRASRGWDGSFASVVLLRDGRWCYVEGWHDSTGYDCQGGVEFKYADSERDLWPLMTEEGRGRLGYPRVADGQAGEATR